MQFALVNNERKAASPGLNGTCPACGNRMIAKCGTVRIHHWAHPGTRSCDSWWEPETEWHRTWKNRFSIQLQEHLRFDERGEKHIADVFTEHGLTIEFQHSHLKPEERAAREAFYKNMVWVVDGTRLKSDLPRFLESFRSFREIFRPGLYVVPFPDEAFPRTWLNCSSPVFFDFGNASGLSDVAIFASRSLWCLLPVRVSGWAVVLRVGRSSFERWMQAKAHPVATRAIAENVAAALFAEQQKQRQHAKLREAQLRQPGWQKRRNYRRGLPRF